MLTHETISLVRSMSSALVSIVMPCFNAGRMLRPALQSVLAQTHRNIEVIFVDNNSTDDSPRIAQAVLGSAECPFTLTACALPGANRARNWGYAMARGDYIQWLDADDQLDPDKIALQVAALEANPGDDIAYGDWTGHRRVRGEPDIVRRSTLRQVDDQLLRVLSGEWYPPHLYLMRRRAADRLQEEQAWWPERGVATDVEYSALAALFGMRFRYVPRTHVQYNVWSDEQTSNSTPLATRTASLRAIFMRLRQLVESGRTAVPLSQRHRLLLYQGWDIWRLPKGQVALDRLSGRKFVLRDKSSGRQIELRPREASIVNWLHRTPMPGTSYHYAATMAATVPELNGCQVQIVELLERLQREGFLQCVAARDGGSPPSAQASTTPGDSA